MLSVLRCWIIQSDRADLEILDAVERLCMAQMHAGHTERAVASLQALVEFNCYPPSQGVGCDSMKWVVSFGAHVNPLMFKYA